MTPRDPRHIERGRVHGCNHNAPRSQGLRVPGLPSGSHAPPFLSRRLIGAVGSQIAGPSGPPSHMATMKGLKLDDFQHVGASYFARQHTTSRSAAKAALPSQAFAFQFPGECDARCARAYVYLFWSTRGHRVGGTCCACVGDPAGVQRLRMNTPSP